MCGNRREIFREVTTENGLQQGCALPQLFFIVTVKRKLNSKISIIGVGKS